MDCPVCYNKYTAELRTPMLLVPCGHTVCQRCLNEIPQSNCPHPGCGKELEKPKQEMPRNLEMLRLIEEKNKNKAGYSTCSETGYFEEYYCETCSVEICIKCFDYHPNHSFQKLNPTEYRVKKLLGSYKGSLDKLVTGFQESIGCLQESEKMFCELEHSKIAAVDGFFQKLYDQINQVRSEVINSVEAHFTPAESAASTASKIAENKGHLQAMQKLSEEVKRSDTQFLQMKTKFKSPSEYLENLRSSFDGFEKKLDSLLKAYANRLEENRRKTLGGSAEAKMQWGTVRARVRQAAFGGSPDLDDDTQIKQFFEALKSKPDQHDEAINAGLTKEAVRAILQQRILI